MRIILAAAVAAAAACGSADLPEPAEPVEPVADVEPVAADPPAPVAPDPTPEQERQRELEARGAVLVAQHGFATDTALEVATLEHAEFFATGGVGYAGSTSIYERAARSLATRPDAAAAATYLVTDGGSPPARFYGLWIFTAIDVVRANKAAAVLRRSTGDVDVFAGCMLGPESPRQLADYVLADPMKD